MLTIILISQFFITSICFIDNPAKALQEAYRIIKQNGDLIIAFIDKESLLGQKLTAEKHDSKFLFCQRDNITHLKDLEKDVL